MTQRAIRVVNFGKSRAGLGTIGFTVLNTDGSAQSARSTTGVYELTTGSGIYAVYAPFPDGFQGSILWDTGESASKLLYAAEEFSYLSANPQVNQLVSGSIIVSGGVLSGSTTTDVHTDISAADQFYTAYTVRIVDSVSGSASRPVDQYLNVSGTFVLDPALPFVPTSGSQVYVLTQFDVQRFLGEIG